MIFLPPPKMCLWDSSQHAKTREVLQQAVLVKRCLASCTVLHTSNYSLLLFCQLQWISCSLYRRCVFFHRVVKLHWPFSVKFFPIKSQIKIRADGTQEQLMSFVYLQKIQALFTLLFNKRASQPPTGMQFVYTYCDHPVKPNAGFWSNLILNPPKIRYEMGIVIAGSLWQKHNFNFSHS